MKVARTGPELRAEIASERLAGRTIAFVPTMGALHEGHLSLLRAARASCDVVLLSIFVNPLQFGPHEDLATYPRAEVEDLSRARAEGVDLVFLPSVEEMYPPGATVTVGTGELGRIHEGRSRPGHFDGVATVLTKLFNIVRPDIAVFGQKDAQQVAVVRRLVRDLDFDIGIVVCPTVRDADGLALSSRNARLSEEERRQAAALFRALTIGAEHVEAEGPEAAAKAAWEVLAAEPGVEPDYAIAVDPDTFGPPEPAGPVLLAVAARVGAIRLIDNFLIDTRSSQGG